MEILKTVRVQLGDSFMIINETDFDKEKHKLYVEPKPPTKAQLKKAAEAKLKDEEDAAKLEEEERLKKEADSAPLEEVK